MSPLDTDLLHLDNASMKSCLVTGRSSSSLASCLICSGFRPAIFLRIDIIDASLKKDITLWELAFIIKFKSLALVGGVSSIFAYSPCLSLLIWHDIQLFLYFCTYLSRKQVFNAKESISRLKAKTGLYWVNVTVVTASV